MGDEPPGDAPQVLEDPTDPNPVLVAILSTVGLAIAIVVAGVVLLCGACGLAG